MTAHNEDVIDLTISFTLASHFSMEDVVIDLESESNSGFETKPPIARRPCQRSSTRTRGTIPSPSTRISIYDLCTPEQKVKRKSRSSIKAQKQTSDESKKNNKEMDSKNCCPICFDNFGRNPLASTKCGHVFCHKCITMALNNDPKCPKCRRKLKGNGAVHPIYL